MKTIRGAITISADNENNIRSATVKLLDEIMKQNDFLPKDAQYVIFSCTNDITAAYPAKFAREIGFESVPLFCVQEMNVVGSLPLCIRVLITVDKDITVKHIYLEKAINLRKDLQ